MSAHGVRKGSRQQLKSVIDIVFLLEGRRAKWWVGASTITNNYKMVYMAGFGPCFCWHHSASFWWWRGKFTSLRSTPYIIARICIPFTIWCTPRWTRPSTTTSLITTSPLAEETCVQVRCHVMQQLLSIAPNASPLRVHVVSARRGRTDIGDWDKFSQDLAADSERSFAE